MDLRKRQPHERQQTLASQDGIASNSSPSTRDSSKRSFIDTILDLILSLIQTLRSLFFGSQDDQRSRIEDEDEDKSQEESILVGYMDNGRIAMHRQKRRNTTRLVLSTNGSAEQSSLRHAAAAHAFLASATHPRLLNCFNPGPPILLADAPLGSLTTFLHQNPTYPPLTHALLPQKTSHLTLPLSWLLQTSSALTFLHTHKLTHGSLSPSSLLLTPSLSITLTDFSKSTINGHTNGFPTREASTFAFPIDALRYDYFDGEMSANSQALGLSIDIFDFATLSYKLLTRKLPHWELPEGNGTWALEELHEALDQRAPELGDEIVVGYVVRDCWCLVYEEGKLVKEDLGAALRRQGYSVDGDEIEGVEEAVKGVVGGLRLGWVEEGDEDGGL